MPDQTLNLEIADSASIAHSSLGAEDRRIVDAWLEHLRRWPDDEFARSRSTPLEDEQDTHIFRAAGFIIAFRISDHTVIVLSIFREETLRLFKAAMKPSR